MARRFAILFVVAMFVGMLPGTAVAADPRFSPGSAGIGDPYFPMDGNGGYNVISYDLNVRYEPSRDRLTGIATIRAKATKNLSRFNLDFDGLRLRSATVNGREARTRRADGELIVTPRSGLRKDSTFTAVFRYDGVPETINDLFGTSGFIHTDDGAIVMGQPHVAATWFPANDHPRDKARFRFRITVPRGVEALANGVLLRKTTSGNWSTWTWDAREPMAPYLAMMAIGQFDVRAYRAAGIKYWDAIDPQLMADQLPAATPTAGSQMLYSQVGEPAYKRLTRVIPVPPGGSTLTFDVNRHTEEGWDFLFVETRTAGGTDWTTLPDANGHTTQDIGRLPRVRRANPFLAHYLTEVPPTRTTRQRPTTTRSRATRSVPVGAGTRSAGWAPTGSTGPSRCPTRPQRRVRSRCRSRTRATSRSRVAASASTTSCRRPASARPASRRTETSSTAGSHRSPDQPAAPTTRTRGSPRPRWRRSRGSVTTRSRRSTASRRSSRRRKAGSGTTRSVPPAASSMSLRSSSPSRPRPVRRTRPRSSSSRAERLRRGP